jgi:hypothetical protein
MSRGIFEIYLIIGIYTVNTRKRVVFLQPQRGERRLAIKAANKTTP